MTENSRNALKHFIFMLPEAKRLLNPDLSNPNDERRMIQFATLLLDNNDTFDIDDIRSVCEEVGGDRYNSLVNSPHFNENFSSIIFSQINNFKNIIDIYRSFQSPMSIDGGTWDN